MAVFNKGMRGNVMKMAKYQQGVTIYGLAFILLVIGFVTFTTLKLFPVYMENFTVRSSVESLEKEADQQFLGVMAVRSALLKRFSMNNVTQVSAEDISISREGQVYSVDVDYEVRVPFIKNISLVISFANHAEVAAR